MQETATTLSLTTGGCAGAWVGQAQYLNNLMQTMASGVADPQSFASLYVGFQDPGPQSIYQAENITNRTLNADAAALGVVQSQAADFQTEDTTFAAIEGCSAGAVAVLAALQANTESNLAIAEQLQMLRQLMMTLINVVAVSNGEVLNEKAQLHAANATNLNGGVMP
jgi:hypothetical protein